MPIQFSAEGAIELGREVLAREAAAVADMAKTLNRDHFARAVELILACRGRVVVSGVGKSGHIGRKVAATLASTGTPAFFVHAAEAAHGDLGMITKDDVLITITGNPASTLAKNADVNLDVHVTSEACPLNLAPTTSTTATLAMGDALAIAAMHAKGFTKEDFARSHPGGALGRRLLTHVRDVMRTGDRVPVVREDASVLEAVREITAKHIGMTAVTDSENRVTGVFTEGDLRRLIEARGDIRAIVIRDVMTKTPKTVKADAMAAAAARILEESLVNQLLVTDDEGRLTGALHLHDLMSAKVI